MELIDIKTSFSSFVGRTVECHLMRFGSGKCNSWIECKQLKYQIQEPLKISYPLHSMVEQQWKKRTSNFVPFLDWGLFTVYTKMQQRHGKNFSTSAAIICHNDELSLSWLDCLLRDLRGYLKITCIPMLALNISCI